MTFEERRRAAEARGWEVREKEFYNPGGTTYRSVLIDADGNERGYVDKLVEQTILGRKTTIRIPDPDAEAWQELSN